MHKKKSHMKKQGMKAKMDEKLGMMHGKESGKKESMASRRHESMGMKKGCRGM